MSNHPAGSFQAEDYYTDSPEQVAIDGAITELHKMLRQGEVRAFVERLQDPADVLLQLLELPQTDLRHIKVVEDTIAETARQEVGDE